MLTQFIHSLTISPPPPGQDPTNTTPTAKRAWRPNNFASINPKSGIIIYCESTPIETSIGLYKTLLKSVKVRVMPIPNMIIPSVGTIRNLRSTNGEGYIYVITEKAIIQNVKNLVIALFRKFAVFNKILNPNRFLKAELT